MLSAIASALKRFMNRTPAEAKPVGVPPAGKKKPVAPPPPTPPSPGLVPTPGDENPLPPTEKQLKYAKRLKIKVEPGMSRRDLSHVISAVVDDRKADAEQKFRPSLLPAFAAVEKALDRIDRNNNYALVAYRWDDEIIVDVVSPSGLEFTQRGEPKYRVSLPELKHMESGGRYMQWTSERAIPMVDLLSFESVSGNLMDDDFERGEPINYQRLVERGMKAASTLPKRKPAK
jgi:hypothetical protein